MAAGVAKPWLSRVHQHYSEQLHGTSTARCKLYTMKSLKCSGVHFAEWHAHFEKCDTNTAHSSIMYTAQYGVHNLQCTVYPIQKTLYSVQHTVYSTFCTVRSTQYHPAVLGLWNVGLSKQFYTK